MVARKILELSLSFFLVVLGISILIGMVSVKSLIDNQKLLTDTTRENQEQLLVAAKQTRDLIADITYAVAVIQLSQEADIIPTSRSK